MASATVNGALMTQTVAARTIAANGAFYFVQDAQGRPMMFSIGDEGIFYLTLPGPSGQNVLVDLSAKFGIPSKSTVTTIAVTQDKTGLIYVVFTEHVGGGANDKIHITAPINPATFDWITPQDLTPYLIPDNSSSTPVVAAKVTTVTQFLLGTNDDGQGFPFLVLEYIDSTGLVRDIAWVQMDSTDSPPKSWSYNNASVLPENASAQQMSSMCAASVWSERGLFCLYSISGQQHLTWVGTDPATHVQNQAVHDVTSLGVQCLYPYLDSDGNTAVVVGASDGLRYFTGSNMGTHTGQSTLLSSDSAFSNLTEVFVTQTDQLFSVWATTSENVVVYQQFDSTMQPTIDAVTLLSGPSGGRFSSMLRSDGSLQQLFVAGADGKMTALEQSQVSRLWKKTPFVVPATNVNYDFTSFTVQVDIVDTYGAPISQTGGTPAQVLLSCDSVITVTCNGQVYTVMKGGTEVSVDAEGILTIIIPTSDIAVPTLQISDVPGTATPFFDGNSVQIDPAANVKAQIAKISDVASLQQQAGQFIPPGTSSSDLATAASAVSQLHNHAQNLASGAVSFKTENLDSIGTAIWDLWNAIEEGVESVLSFVVDIAKDAASFVVTLAGKVLSFALTTVEYCFKAISWVLKTFLNIDLSKLIAWLGSLFGWDDVLDTQKIVAQSMNKLFEIAIQEIPSWAQSADSWLSNLENSIDASLQTLLPANVASQDGGSSSISTSAGTNTQATTARSSPTANWLNYNLKHGGTASALSQGSPSSLSATDDDPVHALASLIETGFTTLADIGGDIIQGIGTIFSNVLKGSYTLEQLRTDLVTILIKVVNDGIDGLKQIVSGAANLLVGVLQGFQSLLNQTLPEIPLLSALWDLISGGEPLTILNVVSLLIALPSTIITKIVTGKPPSAGSDYTQLQALLSQSNTVSFEKLDVASNVEDDPSGFGKFVSLTFSVVRFGIPFGSFASTVLSAMDWAAPDEWPSTVTKAVSFVMATVTIPPDLFGIGGPRPALWARTGECVTNYFQAILVSKKKDKVNLANCLYPVLALRGVFVVASVVEDFANASDYQSLKYSTLWLFEINHLISWGADVLNTVALESRGANEPVVIGYFGASFISFIASLANVGFRTSDNEYDQASCPPPAQLPV